MSKAVAASVVDISLLRGCGVRRQRNAFR
jgi:hypothetical protein